MNNLLTVFVFSEGKDKTNHSFQKCTAVLYPNTNNQKSVNCEFWNDQNKGSDPYGELLKMGLVKDYVGTIEMTVDFDTYEKGDARGQQYIKVQKDKNGNIKKDKDGNPYNVLYIKFLSKDVKASDFHFKQRDTLSTLFGNTKVENIPDDSGLPF